MNDITTALKTAGVETPTVTKRIWMYIKDNPNTSVRTLMSVLKLKQGEVYRVCLNLERRNMLVSKLCEERAKVGRGFGTVNIKRYSTTMLEYEFLPPLVKPIKVTDRPSSVTLIKPELNTTPAQKKIDVRQLTLSEAHVLYIELKEYFGA